MKSKKEVQRQIRELERAYKHVLTGSLATVQINAPRALEQVAAESKLAALYWVLGAKYQSRLRGVDT